MSTRYSIDSAYASKMDDTDTVNSRGAHVRKARGWTDGVQTRSGTASASTSPSPSGSTTDIDLDLDSLFKRLDKYTAEMEEVEARLKRNRSASDDSAQLNIKRFSFEIDQPPSDDGIANNPEILPRPESPQADGHCHGRFEGRRGTHEKQKDEELLSDWAEDVDEPFLIIQSNARSYPEGLLATRTDKDQRSGDKEKVVVPHRVVERESDLYIPIQTNTPARAECLPKEVVTKSPKTPCSTTLTTTSPYAEDRPTCPGFQKGATRTVQDQNGFVRPQDHGSSSTPNELLCSDMGEPCRETPVEYTFPPRTSSKTFSNGDKVERPVESPPKPFQRRTTADHRQSVRHAGFWSAPPLLLLEQDPIPSLPSLSLSSSSEPADTSRPLTPLTLCSPREDQIRRELETFALHEGAETLDLKYKRQRPSRLDLVSSDEDLLDVDDEDVSTTHEAGKKDRGTSEPGRPRPRRSKSIMSIFQRRSPIEKVIDLYLDDDPDEKPNRPQSIWTTISRRGSPTTANMPQSPRVPPLPASSPGFPTNMG
ncbi:hypothetical protein LTR84_011195 [Exophiala bonariae]|uniref:Uncharacterized protein n=1 Tax=Exophiala bonariae TaxID=1690606 RepID=A0AAV9NMA0_9EURO|nr:hypothetical protein LTR84_011195 [Exophiala bonariae]